MSQSKATSLIPRQHRVPTTLTHGLDRKLLGYTAAASAAGAGLMALPQSVEAEIVYTPANQTISANQTLALDLNNDGITDFIFSDRLSRYSFAFHKGHKNPSDTFSYWVGNLNALPETGNRVLINHSSFAAALPGGRKVGPGEKWNTAEGLMATCGSGSGIFRTSGPWHGNRSSYLGLAFSIEGKIHYGWARLNVSQSGCLITAVLTGYAYETVANKPITAGATSETSHVSATDQPHATLGLLAQGSIGLAAWRRDEDANRGWV
jgi:hypothetical protein